MARKKTSLSGTNPLERFSTTFAADYRFDGATARRGLSDFYTEFALTPAPWLKWEVFHRYDLRAPQLLEFNTALEIIDQKWWSARFATHSTSMTRHGRVVAVGRCGRRCSRSITRARSTRRWLNPDGNAWAGA